MGGVEQKEVLTAAHVLERAADEVKAGRGDPRSCKLGEWCPWCLIDHAKTWLDLDDASPFKTDGFTVGQAIQMFADVTRGRFTPMPGDEPLVEARNFLGRVAKHLDRPVPVTRDEAITALEMALALAKAECAPAQEGTA